MKVEGKNYRTVWMEGSVVRMINQPLLPHRFEITDLPDYKATGESIRTMIVRGAGAMGGTAGYAVAQAALSAPDAGFHDYMAEAASFIEDTRPTAQNLFYAVRRVMRVIQAQGDDLVAARQAAVAEAQAIADDYAACCEAIGDHGGPLIGHKGMNRRVDGGAHADCRQDRQR